MQERCFQRTIPFTGTMLSINKKLPFLCVLTSVCFKAEEYRSKAFYKLPLSCLCNRASVPFEL